MVALMVQGPVKETLDDLFDLGLEEMDGAMAGPLQFVEIHGDMVSRQLVIQQLALMEVDLHVVVAVEDQERRRLIADVCNRASLGQGVPVLRFAARQQAVGEEGSPLLSIFRKSVGPYQSQTAWTSLL